MVRWVRRLQACPFLKSAVLRWLLRGGAAGGVTNNRRMTINGLSVNINGYEAKDDNDLADTIVHRINDMLNEDDSVWGK